MRIRNKIKEIQEFITELAAITPKSFLNYKADFKTRAACERYFEKIIEAAVDLAFLIIKEEGYKTPEEDKEAFDTLAKEKLIPKELAEKLKEAKGMRNILAHMYGNVDDKIVFNSITEELERDINDLLENISKKER